MFFGLQYFTWNVPSGPRMSYFCTAIVSAARVASTRSSDARRLLVPVAAGSSGLSGKTSNSPRPSVSSRVVCVARRRASVAATIVKRGASGQEHEQDVRGLLEQQPKVERRLPHVANVCSLRPSLERQPALGPARIRRDFSRGPAWRAESYFGSK